MHQQLTMRKPSKQPESVQSEEICKKSDNLIKNGLICWGDRISPAPRYGKEIMDRAQQAQKSNRR
jgi:hypothetical protein